MAYSQGCEYAYVLYKDDYILPDVIIWTNVSLNVPCSGNQQLQSILDVAKRRKRKGEEKDYG